MLPQLLSYVFWNLYVRENKFLIEKPKIFLFQVFQVFSSYNSVWIRFRVRIRIRTFVFGFGSSQNIRIISDSDPQHWVIGSDLLIKVIKMRYRYRAGILDQKYR
jgi:hypothetical protein